MIRKKIGNSAVNWQEYCHKLNPDSIRFNSLFFASSLQAIRLRVCRQSWRIREGDTDLPGHLWSSTKLFPLFFCRVKWANTTGYWIASLFCRAMSCGTWLKKKNRLFYLQNLAHPWTIMAEFAIKDLASAGDPAIFQHQSPYSSCWPEMAVWNRNLMLN